MKDRLFEIFSNRPDRFRLLHKGLEQIAFAKDGFEQIKAMEIGCGYGDASAYVAQRYDYSVTGIDITEQKVEFAKQRHIQTIQARSLSFLTADTMKLPVLEKSFDFVFAEAAFSPLGDKRKAAREWHRILKNDGYILINDFAIKNHDTASTRETVAHIPCFAGVDTIERYEKHLTSEGFRPLAVKEEYGELIRLALWISKSLDVDIGAAGGYLSRYYNANGGASCEAASEDNDFFKQSQLTYCQMIFKK